LSTKEATAKVKSSKSEQISADLNFVYNYVAYNYLSRRIQRNLMLVNSLRLRLENHERVEGERFIGGKYQDIVKLYDNVLQVPKFNITLQTNFIFICLFCLFIFLMNYVEFKRNQRSFRSSK